MKNTDTAILNIIKEDYDTYLCMVICHGFEYLPSVMPMFRTGKLTDKKKNLERDIALLSEIIHQEKDFFGYIDMLLKKIQEIGEYIYKHFEMRNVLKMLFENPTIKNLIIITDDASIPWLWAYDDKQFLCERFAYGKLFIKDIRKDMSIINNLKEYLETEEYPDEDNWNKYFSAREALLLSGGMSTTENKVMISIDKEIKNLQYRLEKELKLKTSVENSHKGFYKFLEEHKEKVKIFHYAGPMFEGKIMHSKEVPGISALQINDIISNIKLSSQPLVFLNSCKPYYDRDGWREEALLATTFLDMGATCCINSIFSLDNKIATEFAEQFYKIALKEGVSVGTALQETRIYQKGDDMKENDITRLFFDFYGDPRRPIFKQVKSTNSAIQILQKKNSGIEEGFNEFFRKNRKSY